LHRYRYRNEPRPPGCQRIAGQALKRLWCSEQKTWPLKRPEFARQKSRSSSLIVCPQRAHVGSFSSLMIDILPRSLATIQRIQPFLGNPGVWQASSSSLMFMKMMI
jgi:hypothetical protein